MRTAFTFTGESGITVRAMSYSLKKRLLKVQEGLVVEGFPTDGKVLGRGGGYIIYANDEKKTLTMIAYRWGTITVTVIGGDEQIKKEWKKFLRSFHLGEKPKRGRPKKLATSDK